MTELIRLDDGYLVGHMVGDMDPVTLTNLQGRFLWCVTVAKSRHFKQSLSNVPEVQQVKPGHSINELNFKGDRPVHQKSVVWRSTSFPEMSSDTERVDIIGRTFQKISIDDKIYLAPIAVDDREEDRLAAQHRFFSRVLGNHLISDKIPLVSPRKVLDCGYGGGDWCVQFAEEYEECEVTAVDIFPLRVADQPENLTLCGYNLNDRLRDPDVFQNKAYDLIHSRFVYPGIRGDRWSSYIGDMRLLLKPGGWLQMAEFYPLIQSDSGKLAEGAAVRRWWKAYEETMVKLNRDPRIGRRFQQILTQKGYRDVSVDVERLSLGDWHPDPVKSSIGREASPIIADLLETLGVWSFIVELGWTAEQYSDLLQEIRAELANVELKLYIDCYIARGRRSTGGG